MMSSHAGARSLAVLIVGTLLAVTGVADTRGAAAAEPSGADQLARVVQAANKEGRLVATVQSSWPRDLLPKLGDAFKKRFGLTIDVTVTPTTSATQFPLEIAAVKAGAPPTYDVMQGDDAETMQLEGAGGFQAIPNWKTLLAAVNPDVRYHRVSYEAISREPFEGISFLYMGNVKQLIYNTKLMTPADLPKTHADLAQAKYAGKFTQPPWTSHWEVAPQVFSSANREKFLDVVRAAGKNTGAVLNENIGVERVVLGQYAFALAQDTYLRQTLAKDPQAPIAGVFMRDYNELNAVYYSVRTKAAHPNAAALWALWMTTAEAEAIWQPVVFSLQPYGSSTIDIAERNAIRANHATVIGYLDNAQTLGLLKWQQTPAGTQYLAAIAKAIRGE
jgi:ABC-type Fe3+ transport system substrate-binding protein